MNLILDKCDDKYIIRDLDVMTINGDGVVVLESAIPDDPFEFWGLQEFKTLIKIVNEHNKVKPEKLCATCDHYDMENNECEIRDIARPTPPRKVHGLFGCGSWTN